jgi:hypothetical protein
MHNLKNTLLLKLMLYVTHGRTSGIGNTRWPYHLRSPLNGATKTS